MVDKDSVLSSLADESFSVFAEVHEQATKELEKQVSNPVDSFAYTNAFTGNNFHRLSDILGEGRQLLEQLYKEPAIHRVLVEDEDDNLHEIYFVRLGTYGVRSTKRLVSKKHPWGTLATLEAGEWEEINFNGRFQELRVIETASFVPVKLDNEWDAINVRLDHYTVGAVSISSLKSRPNATEGEQDILDELDSILAEENIEVSVDGFEYQVRTAMGLRDQPILDKFQDRIYRQPLDTQLVILGPPGTGKTTTLIHRLGLKRDSEHLSSAELKLAKEDYSNIPHVNSWIMFTPTDLLKHYVKEAFAKENIPASDDKIRTWESARRSFSRNIFGLLQSSTNKGKFILRKELTCLKSETLGFQEQWFDDLEQFHLVRQLSILQDGIALIDQTKDHDSAKLVDKILNIVNKSDSTSLVKVYIDLLPLESKLSELVDLGKRKVDEIVRSALVKQFKENRLFLSELAELLNQNQINDDDTDDYIDSDDDIGEQPRLMSFSLKTASEEYSKAIKALARQKFLGRKLSTKSRACLIVNWLGEKLPSDAELKDLGKRVVHFNALRLFISAHRRLVKDVASTYKAFRKARKLEGRYYLDIMQDRSSISEVELDAVLLLSFRTMRTLLGMREIVSRIDESSFSYLKTQAQVFKNQVLVDEATDFSIIQLACMKNLAHPEIDSFIACGDFNQRIVSSGVTNSDQLSWLLPENKVHTITALYRQSRKLNDYAYKLLNLTNGDLSSVGTVSEKINHDGVSPVLKEFSEDIDTTAFWLSERIIEINKLVNRTSPSKAQEVVPTIAVLVDTEEKVESIAYAFNKYLEEISLTAEACKDGKSLGDAHGVRVFSVEYIKGLEFEAVFFVGIDELALKFPDLFDKYLYVGVTRAATYLGMTCTQTLPKILEPLKDVMAHDFYS